MIRLTQTRMKRAGFISNMKIHYASSIRHYKKLFTNENKIRDN
jgi:hypothetical protein